MYCQLCQAECLSNRLPNGHISKFGVLNFDDQAVVFVFEISLTSLLKAWANGKKIVRWWVGTDVLLLRMFPPGRGKFAVLKHRLKAWLTEPFIAEHWIYGEQLFKEFKEVWGSQKACLRLCSAPIEPVTKIPSESINIAYYHPRDDVFSRWVYGIDLIEKLVTAYPQVNWIKLDGTLNPKYFFQSLSGYIRPSRSDGLPRTVEECKIHGVPYYWSSNRKPNIDEMRKFVESLL